ncbi:MAG: hypothetical protein JW395_3026 [Nitrospira sp.]|nr:hypothetical protein [Nitrospira sp.]
MHQPIHRWFRLTPSYGPKLVEDILEKFGCDRFDSVYDPFAGAGTTLIHCQLNGLTAYGTEINPFLHWVCDTSLSWRLEPATIHAELKEISSIYKALDASLPIELDALDLPIPPIHNPLRWWRPDILRQLLILKHAIQGESSKENTSFFLLALASALIPDLSNITLGRLQLHFIDRSNDSIKVLDTFLQKVSLMIADLSFVQATSLDCKTNIFLSDATKPLPELVGQNITHVITSPPYPNRYSYVWNTRPFLYFFDFMSTPGEASHLDLRSIGGTWGTATYALAKGRIEPESEAVARCVMPIVETIRSVDNLMANYVLKYFNMLAGQIITMDGYLASGAEVAYVVGCSRIKGQFVETDVLLGKLFEGLGYATTSIERIRKRNSGKDLHESIVYARKP